MQLNQIDHIGIAVKDLKAATDFYRSVFGCQISEEMSVPERKLKIAFIDVSGVKMEFIMGTDRESVISKFIEKKGEGIHHICLEVDDAERAVSELKEKGVELVDQPRMGAEGKKIVFLQPKSMFGVLIELKEK
jgi:methylmalonyl-CoA epimerase